MHFSSLARQIVAPDLQSDALTPPSSVVSPLIEFYNRVIDKYNQNRNTSRPYVCREDFRFPEKVHLPVDDATFEAMILLYSRLIPTQRVGSTETLPAAMFYPETLEEALPDPEIRARIVHSLHKLQEANHLIQDTSNSNVNFARNTLGKKQYASLCWSIMSQAHRAALGLSPTSINEGSIALPNLEGPVPLADASPYLLATLYILRRIIYAFKAVSTLIYQGKFTGYATSDFTSLQAAAIACVDPGLGMETLPEEAVLYEQLLTAYLEMIEAFYTISDPNSIRCRSVNYINQVSINFDRFPHLQDKQSRVTRRVEDKLHRILSRTLTPMRLVLLPVIGEAIWQWLSLCENTAATLAAQNNNSGTLRLPFIPLQQPDMSSELSDFILPDIIGIRSRPHTNLVYAHQTTNPTLPERALVLEVKDSHLITLPVFFGINAAGFFCMLIPHNPNTMDYLRTLYGNQPKVDRLRGYGPVTKQLMHPNASTFAAFLSSGNFRLVKDTADNVEYYLRFRFGEPALVDIRRYFNDPAANDTETPETDIFWELPMVADGGADMVGYGSLLHSLFLNQPE